MTIEAYKDPSFNNQLKDAALLLADGKPLSIACQLLYKKKQDRIAGMDFMPRSLEALNEAGGTVFFYGSSLKCLLRLKPKWPRSTLI
nr:WecB/TagA/CpsF family glycosyltransferase [Paraflavitalea speifideiaquila]